MAVLISLPFSVFWGILDFFSFLKCSMYKLHIKLFLFSIIHYHFSLMKAANCFFLQWLVIAGKQTSRIYYYLLNLTKNLLLILKSVTISEPVFFLITINSLFCIKDKNTLFRHCRIARGVGNFFLWVYYYYCKGFNPLSSTFASSPLFFPRNAQLQVTCYSICLRYCQL